MKVSVNSEKQTGGVTGNVIHVIDQQNNSTKKNKKKSWYSNIWVVTIVSGIIIAIVSGIIVDFFTKNINREDMQDIKVTSFNQSGGITANQVNIESPNRELTEKMKVQLVSYLKENKPVEIWISAVMGDAESLRYAEQINDYLINQGYVIKNFNIVQHNQPMFGVTLDHSDDNKIDIIVGTKN